MKRISVLVLALLFCSTQAVRSQGALDISGIIVTATKTPKISTEIGSASTIITSEEIEKSGKKNIAELLRNVTGINVVRTSGTGSQTLLYMRGCQPGQVMVMIDGVEVSDPMEIDGGFFDFNNVSTANVERVEIIRGPQSALYGSSAMAGVINIITKKAKPAPTADISLEGGSYNTFRSAIGAGASTKKVNFSVGGAFTDTKGYSSAAPGEESDGASLYEVSGNMRYSLNNDIQIEASIRHDSSELDIDDDASTDDPNYKSTKTLDASKIQFNQKAAGWWDYSVSASLLNTKREYIDTTNPGGSFEDMSSRYDGAVQKLNCHNNFYIFDTGDFSIGADYQKDSGESFYKSASIWGIYEEEFTKRSAENSSAYIQHRSNPLKNFYTTLGIRMDSHQYFNTETTYNASASYPIEGTGLRFSGSYGKGFKAPSVYQLFSSYGDINLKPETNHSYDFGFDQSLSNGKLNFGAKYFHNDLRELIQFSTVLNTYSNVSEAVTKGVESQIGFMPFDSITLKINYTYMDTQDKTAGRELLTRPKSSCGAFVGWQISPKLDTSLNINYTGKTLQYMRYPVLSRNPSFTIAGLSLNYELSGELSIFATGENIFDKQYQELYGYKSPGASYYAGIKLGIY